MKFPLRHRRHFLFALLFLTTGSLAFGINWYPWRAKAATPASPGSQSSPAVIWQRNGTTQAEGRAGQLTAWQLNSNALEEVLSRAPREFTAPGNNTAVLALPMPGGALERFQIEESPLMEPALAAKFPTIKTYRAQGLDNPAVTARLLWSPRGFHAFVLTNNGAVSIQPAHSDDIKTYVSYASQDLPADAQELRCLVDEKEQARAARPTSPNAPAASVGGTLRVYRVAIATTVEYTNQANLGGGTVANTLASLATWLSGINAIMEKEVAVRLVLVGTNNTVIFTAEPDGFTNGNNNTMINEVPAVLSANIGSANFDIGHVFGTIASGGSGLAGVGIVCDSSASSGGQRKAQGSTLFSGPSGQSGQLGVIAHEFGHELGASHTFNALEASGNCAAGNRSGATAYEVASGSTLMSYGGICTTNNLSGKEFRLHAGSFAQITTILAAATCNNGNWIATGNNVPTVTAGGNFTIPKQTPFTLTASGADADVADVPNLTYTWDQIDAGGSLYPNPLYGDQAGDPNTTTRPLFRPYPAASSPARTFPSLTYILNNANVPPATVGGFITGENPPSVARTMNFRATIRDNRAGGGGVNEATAVITVDGPSGPFAVTSPNGANNITGGAATAVTWNVAGTSGAPINTANVKLSLSTDGGNTFPIVLAASTPNDGSQSVTFPNGLLSTMARVKVEALGNIYFDISDADFSLTPGDGCPAVSNFSPPIINIGGQVVLTGINFTSVTAVNFTGANVNCPSANCTVNSNTQITLTVPAGATTGPLTIVKAGCTNLQTAALIICPNAAVTLTYDGGFGSNCNGFGAGAYYVVRTTPSAYPATLSNVLVEFSGFQGIAQGTAFTVVAAPNPSGSTNINGVSFQSVNATVGALGSFTSYAITPVTINSGDFVVGFSFPTNTCSGLHDGTLTANRSYISSDNGATFSAAPGDWLIRAQVFTGNCAGASNTAPAFTPAAAIARQQGSAAGAAVTVGTVTDNETAAGSLTVTQIAGGTATGITVTGITNTNGTITAQVSAACNATSGTVRFQVSDGSLTGTGDLTVNVTANTAPTLAYANAAVNGGGSTTNSPTTATDNGSITGYSLQSQGTYTGTISVNPTTGVVSFSNAAPLGTHTITVTATDNCNATTNASFTLTVNNTAPSFTPAAALSRQQGSAAGAAVTVGTVTDAQTAAGSLTVTQIAGGTATGITVSGITNTGGTITAQVSAGCTATSGTVRFQVSDGALTGTGDLTVNVTANTLPTLTYANANVAIGGATTVNAATGPTDNGAVNTIVLQGQGTYGGTISVNNGTGAVTISNAMPVGTHTITIRATDNCGAFFDASFTLTVSAVNTAPTFTPAAALTRQQGSPAGAAVTVGTVADAQTAAGSLTVTQIAGGTATGITVSGITNTGGTITAQVSAACGATSGTVRFQVSDGSLTGTGDLTVNVTANTAPTLGYSTPQNVAAGGALTVNPSTGPSDNGNVASIVLQSQGTYTGTISVNNGTGAVTISNANPPGSHTIMVRATDNCGATTDGTFTLNVSNTAPTFTPAAALSRQQGSPAGAAVTVGTAADASTAAGSLTVTQIAGGTATGITVTGITNTGGTITALVSAGCTATSGTVRFQVSDGSLTGTGDLTVNVTANTPPALTYNNQSAALNGGLNINPASGPSDNGSVNTVVVQSQGTYTGTITVNAAGVVTLGNAGPLGAHTITIRATDNCGVGTDASFTLTVRRNAVKADFDGDGKTDLSVFSPTAAPPFPNWTVFNSSNSATVTQQWGAGYAPYFDDIVPGDYDGDGKADHAIWRGADSIWYIRKSSDGQAILQFWGANYAPYFDIPTPGDYDGDGKTDIGVFRRSGTWFVRRSSDGQNMIVTHGQQDD
ncbi:MAG: hypothetical protein HY011_12800, partial [Acidobacteria bacterium]|nr:hypothetical protein [Acidobacteriota bacterium]